MFWSTNGLDFGDDLASLVSRVCLLMLIDLQSVDELVGESLQPASALFGLDQNTPNPFNPTTRISFNLPQAGNVQLSVFDVRGREIVRLVNGPMNVGRHTVEWSGRTSSGDRVASGVYYYILPSGTFHQTRRMVLLK